MDIVFVISKWKIELFTVLFICFFSRTVDGIKLTVSPSYDVEVNQTVTLTCELDLKPTPPVIVFFESNFTEKLCFLEHSYGKCINSSDTCVTRYNASCHNETLYSLQFPVPWNWNGASIYCKTLYSKSESVVFAVKVPVTSVTLTPTPITVIAGQEMNVNCTTSYCHPPADITWYMSLKDITSLSASTKDKMEGLVRTGSSLSINLGKSDNGKYVFCTTSNIPGQNVTSMVNTVTVLFKPELTSYTPNPYAVIEGQSATLKCALTGANPNTSIIWRWFRTDRPNAVLYNGPNYTIPIIQRNMSGSYNCTARNYIGTSEAVTINVDVQYKPHIVDTPSITVNESDRAVLFKEIVSNPVSNVSWYNGSELLLTQASVRTATLFIEKAVCTDTKNFTLVASNTVERKVWALVELLVNCKPRTYFKNITLEVTDNTGIEFSTTIIAYPEPRYELRYENGTINYRMMSKLKRNAVNNFTIYYNQTVVEQDDYGTYHLFVSNAFGDTTVFLNVLPQRKPNRPRNTEIFCEQTGAKVQWISSFNGGDVQSFTVTAMNGQYKESESNTIADKGENEIHAVYIQNLQPLTTYLFYISARNRHGFSSSGNFSCTTLTENTGSLSIIYGSAATGGITLAIVVIVVVVLLRRFKNRDNNDSNSNRDDPMKTNEDPSHYTTLAERDVTTERNFYEILTKNESANQYEACLMKENHETNGQIYQNLQKTEITDKRNICDKQMIDKNPKDFSKIYVNHSVTENSAEYINLSFSK